MIRRATTVQFVREFALVWCIIATAVNCASPYRRNITDAQRSNKCVYRNVEYEAGAFVKTGEPCLNCTCNDGIIVCHLRICSPVPNPPPHGCFILHKKDVCCSELVCNEDNNIVFDGLEARSRPGANDETELELENFAKTQHDRGCLINGTMYAEGSALTSSTDCEYCFCMKGKERCVKPNCTLKLAACTPVFKKHACCPVKYNCHGSDNVTIISTELAFAHHAVTAAAAAAFDTKITTSATTPTANEELLNIGDENRNDQRQTQSSTRNAFTTRQFSQSSHTEQFETTPAISERRYASTSGGGDGSSSVSSYSTVAVSHPSTTVAAAETGQPFVSTTRENDVAESDSPTTETVTEISTSISLIATELTLQNDAAAADETGRNATSSVPNDTTTMTTEQGKNFSVADEQRNFTESTIAYERTSKSNFTSEPSSSAVTVKTIPLEIEALLNITKKKQEGDYEVDYDEPRLPPSLPNLKIIPFVAADALDKPKDATIEHREDTAPATDPIDAILDGVAAAQFSPPVKTEGGFVPRDPTLDGPFFESKYDGGVYHRRPTDENVVEMHSEAQITLPSITEPPKIVENALCTNGHVTYRHGELISEPKACNMCLCLYGEIVCQEPVCPTLQPGCRRIKYNEDVSNCCGEIICDETISKSSTTIAFEPTEATIVSSESNVSSSTAPPPPRQIDDANQTATESSPTPTLPLINPTYMTIKVKGKNQTTTERRTSTTFASNTSPLVARVTASIDGAATSSPVAVVTTRMAAAGEKSTTTSTSEKTDNDYDSGFSFENMLSFLFDEPPGKNVTVESSTPVSRTSSEPTTVSTAATTRRNATTANDQQQFIKRVDTIDSTAAHPAATTTMGSATSAEADSIIYVIKNNDSAQSKTALNAYDEPSNVVKHVNAYYVPPLGNFDEVILNPTNKPFETNTNSRKPAKGGGASLSTTFRPRHTTAKVIPLMGGPPPVITADPGAASGLLKLSGCNIFGKMYRVGKIISELSGPCLQCMCVEVGVQCVPLKC